MKRTLKFSLIILVLGFATNQIIGQGTFVPLDKDIYSTIDRYEIKNGELADQFHSSYKPYRRQAVVDFFNKIDLDSSNTVASKADEFNTAHFKIDNWQYDSSEIEQADKPVLKWFYKKKPDWFSVDNEDIKLRVNPVIYFGANRESYNAGNGTGVENNNLYINTRGVVVEGMIDNKVGFYTFMADNQMIVPNYVGNYAGQYHLPYQGFLKSISDSTGEIPNTYDFFTARGYFTVNATEHINVQFGHDRHFIGNGYRSLILSDNSPNYLFLKLSTQIWKIKYTNLFTEMNAEDAGQLGDRVLEKKYMMFHHLSWNVRKNVNIGLWESIPYGRDNRSIELQYMNPIIFYRSVEQQLGSGDNAIIGGDFKWHFKNHFSLYGQLVLDEFKLSDFRARNGAFTNKQGFQLGAKYVDAFGVKNLDLQLERNYVRPYTYQHKDNYRSYSNNSLPLAHPLGANFKEWVAIARYQPTPKLKLEGRIFAMEFGVDSGSSNVGSNTLLDYSSASGGAGYFTGQGIPSVVQKVDFIVSYQAKHNLFIDLTYTRRSQNYTIVTAPFNSSSTIIGGAIRWNINRRTHDF